MRKVDDENEKRWGKENEKTMKRSRKSRKQIEQ
jgi:hypothetical protein